MPGKGASRSTGRTSDQFVSDAPVFYPTLEDMADFGAYIEGIRPRAEGFGLCKVIPPHGFSSSFAIDRKQLAFRTRVQIINQLQERVLTEADFMESYKGWLEASKKTTDGKLTISGRDLKLFNLFKTVRRMGGYDKVTKDDLWKVACRIVPGHKKGPQVASQLKQLYQKHLLEYEQSLVATAKAAEEHNAQRSERQQELDRDVQRAIASGNEMKMLLSGLYALILFGRDQPGQPHRFPHLDATLDRLREKAQKAAQKSNLAKTISTMVCETCKQGSHEDKIILCDSCDNGHHISCLDPPLQSIPEGDWLCPRCVATPTDRTAFREGKEQSFEAFEAAAAAFKNNFFGSKTKADKASVKEIEAAFWKIVEDAGPDDDAPKEKAIEVMYGADLDTSVTGSGFPVKGRLGVCGVNEETQKLTESQWNLNNLPRLDCSLLKHMGDDVMGVTKPWMYLGMLFSAFCWHIEDHMMYSVNYHHFGDIKRWYGVPAMAASEFEHAFKTALPEAFEQQPDILVHMDTMISPRILQTYKVPVYALSQGPGEVVITFPRAYHAGFNTGLNCAEAVNFAPADWLRFGEQSLERFKMFHRQPVFCHSRILLQAVADNPTASMADYMIPELERLVDMEREWRYRVRETGCFKASRVEQPVGMTTLSRDDEQCAVDQSYLHLSAVSCKCCPKRFVSLKNARNLCECHPSNWRLFYRHSLAELEGILDTLYNIAGRPVDERRKGRVVYTGLPTLEERDLAKSGPAESGGAEQTPSVGEAAPMEIETEAKAEAKSSGDNDDPPRKESPQKEAEFVVPASKRMKGRKSAPIKAEKTNESSPEVEKPKKPAKPAARVTRAAKAAKDGQQAEREVAEILLSLHTRTDLPKSEASSSQGSPIPTPSSAVTPSPAAGPKRAVRVSARQLARADLLFDKDGSSKATTAAFSEAVYASLTGEFDLPSAFQKMANQKVDWMKKVNVVFQNGGARPATVETLVQQSQQYLWADLPFQEEVTALLQSLKGAQAWAHKVQGFLKTKAPLEEVESALQSAPINVANLSKLVEGVQAAKAWIARYTEAQSENGTVELKALEGLVQDAAKLPILIPELKDMKERLTGGRTLQHAVLQATTGTTEPPPPEPSLEVTAERPRSKRRKVSTEQKEAAPAPPPPAEVPNVTAEYLKSLKARALALKLTSPEIGRLCDDLAGLESLQERISEALNIKQPLEVVKNLYQEAQELSLELPELKRVKKIMNDARTWLIKLPSMSNPKVAFKKLRDFSNQGNRLGVDLPEVAELRRSIRIREYEDATRKMLHGKPKLEAIEGNLRAAAQNELEELESAKNVRDLLARANAWVQRASAFLSQEGLSSLEDLEAIAKDGNLLRVRLDMLDGVNAHHAKVQGWVDRVNNSILSNEDSSQYVGLDKIDEMLALYEDPHFKVKLSEAEALHQRKQDAFKWIQVARQTLQKDISELLRPEFEGVIAEGEALRLRLEELDQLKRQVQALDWEREVAVLPLKADPRTAAQVQYTAQPSPPVWHPETKAAGPATSMETLARKASNGNTRGQNDGSPKRTFDQINLETQELDLQSEFKRQALAGSNGATVALPVGLIWPGATGQGGSQTPPAALDAFAGQHPPALGSGQSAEAASQPDGASAHPQKPPGQVPSVAQIQPQRTEPQPAPEEVEIPSLTVEEARQRVEEGRRLGVNQELIQKLLYNISLAEEWHGRLEQVASHSAKYSPQHAAVPAHDRAALRPLILEAKRMVPQPDSLAALEAGLKKSDEWSNRVHNLFRGRLSLRAVPGDLPYVDLPGDKKPWYCEVAAVAHDGQGLLVQTGYEAPIEAVMQEVSDWKAHCFEQFSPVRKEIRRLDKCVGIVRGRLNTAKDQLDRCIQTEKKRTGPVRKSDYGLNAILPEISSNRPQVYCFCQSAGDDDVDMVECDNCKEWYHCYCLGTTVSKVKQRKRFICPLCSAAEARQESDIDRCASDLQKSSALIRETRRPTTEMIEDMIKMSERLPCKMEEARDLRHLLNDHREWSRDVTLLLQRHRAALASMDAACPLTPGLYEDANEAEESSSSDEDSQEDEGPSSPSRNRTRSASVSSGVALPAGSSQMSRPLTLMTLKYLLRSSISLEISHPHLEADLWNALKTTTWRRDVLRTFGRNARQPLSAMAQILLEGSRLFDQASNNWASPLIERLSVFTRYMRSASELPEEIKQKSEQRMTEEVFDECRSLKRKGEERYSEAKRLKKAHRPRGFERSMEKLKTWDPEEPMLGCDLCEEWFHYDCMGLRKPGDDEVDADVAPQNYRCPFCCRKAVENNPMEAHAHRYPHPLPRDFRWVLEPKCPPVAAMPFVNLGLPNLQYNLGGAFPVPPIFIPRPQLSRLDVDTRSPKFYPG